MSNTEIDMVVDDLIFIREKLHNGIYGQISTPALTKAISLLREFQTIKTEKGGVK